MPVALSPRAGLGLSDRSGETGIGHTLEFLPHSAYLLLTVEAVLSVRNLGSGTSSISNNSVLGQVVHGNVSVVEQNFGPRPNDPFMQTPLSSVTYMSLVLNKLLLKQPSGTNYV